MYVCPPPGFEMKGQDLGIQPSLEHSLSGANSHVACSDLVVCSFCLILLSKSQIHAAKLWRPDLKKDDAQYMLLSGNHFCRTKNKCKEAFVYLVPKKTMLSMWFSLLS
jgi:hypothetical protein